MSATAPLTLAQSLARHKADYLTALLQAHAYNVTSAAREAGLHRTSFYKTCERAGVPLRAEPPLPLITRVFADWVRSPL